MSIRLDPRRLSTLKRLAADAGVRPGDLVRTWVEERIDGARAGDAGVSLADQLAALVARVDALEAAAGAGRVAATPAEPSAPVETEPAPRPEDEPAAEAKPRARRARKASAKPRDKVALHDEMIAVLVERGPMTAADLAAAVVERGHYHPPRSGKPIDAAMISQRVSNPTYRSRFTRNEGRIGLAG